MEGIHELIGGLGQIMGYGYENAKEIFTDINLPAPLFLIGSEAGFEARAQAAMERRRSIKNPFDEGWPEEKDQKIPEDEDWPFS